MVLKLVAHNKDSAGHQCHTTLISALWKQRQVDLLSLRAAWSTEQVQDSQGYTVKLYLKKQQQNPTKQNPRIQ